MDSLSLDNLSYLHYAMIFLATIAAAFISGVGGFGGAFVIAFMLTPIIGVKAIVPLIAVFAFIGNLSRLAFYFRTVDWPIAGKYFLSSLPGVYIGTTIFKTLPERPLLLLFGAILILAIPLRRYLKSRSFSPGWKTIFGFGFLYGCISGTAVGAGMFVVAGLLSIGMQGPLLLGTDALIGLMNSSSRIVAFRYHGLLTNDLIITGAIMGIATIPGTWMASALVKRTKIELHSMIIEVLIVLGGIMMLVNALS